MATPGTLQAPFLLYSHASTDPKTSDFEARIQQRGINVCDPPYGAVGDGVTDDTVAFQAALAAASAQGGGIVLVPPKTFKVSQLTFDGFSHVVLEGVAPNFNYGNAPTSATLAVTSGVWGVRLPITSSYCGLRNIGLISNGALNATVPHAVITPGIEYGVLIETGSTIMDGVDVYGFQYGCVVANLGNSNVFERCAFVWNTKCGFAITYGSTSAYAAYHPNLVATIPGTLDKTTVLTIRDCKIRRNGWGMIFRDGAPIFEGVNVIESNFFGGMMAATGSLDLGGVGLSGRLYLENNWSDYDETSAYTITQNNLLKDTASTWLPWTSAVPTAGNDAGYNLYAWSDPTNTGTTKGPNSSSFYTLAIVNSSGGPTGGKAMYLKQCIFWKFYSSSATGGDSANSVKLGDGTGGYLANAVHFYDWSGTLPTGLGNRGAQFDSERQHTLGATGVGGQTATQGYFSGLWGNLQFPDVQVPSSHPNCLDDYEEGAWTPIPTSLTVVGTPTYTGTYTKVGRRVHCVLHIVSTTSTASVASTTFFSGLPFTPNTAVACMAVSSAVASFGNGLVGTNGHVNTPTWSATADVTVSFSYDV